MRRVQFRVIASGVTSTQKQQLKPIGNSIRKICNRFSKTTSFQLLENILYDDIPKGVRFFYLFIFIGSLTLSTYYTIELYTKWLMSPIIISDSSAEISIATFAFPAVTICNLNLAKRSMAEKIQPGTRDFIRLQSICKNNADIHYDENESERNWDVHRTFIMNLSQSCSEMILICRYGFILQNCSLIFEEVLTDHGICCTFNSVHPDFIYTVHSKGRSLNQGEVETKRRQSAVRYTSEDGYKTSGDECISGNGQLIIFPERASVFIKFLKMSLRSVGVPLGLTLVLNASLNEYFCSASYGQGFKFLMHSPTEIPKVANYGHLIGTKKETRILITPTGQNTAAEVRSLSLSDRHCLYNSESNLEYFKVYSSVNCELECIAKLMEKQCGCVQIYLPRSSNRTEVCGLKDIKCVNMINMEVENLNNSFREYAKCLPSCVHYIYSPSITESSLLDSHLELAKFLPTGYNISDLAVIHVFYKDRSIRPVTLEVYLEFLDFFSNSGGIYSLFLGFSILSLIELCYLAVSVLTKMLIRNQNQNTSSLQLR